ncbi:hypothetical protein NL676_018959 [Syzygium grande]|nr:hypothetical protein NL676_018959 [Syzygium grande]
MARALFPPCLPPLVASIRPETLLLSPKNTPVFCIEERNRALPGACSSREPIVEAWKSCSNFAESAAVSRKLVLPRPKIKQ